MLFQIMIHDNSIGEDVIVDVYSIYCKNGAPKAIVYYNNKWIEIDLNLNGAVPIEDDYIEKSVLATHPNIKIMGQNISDRGSLSMSHDTIDLILNEDESDW